MQNNYTDILTKFGLSINEAKVYIAMLKKNTSQVAELVSLSGVPQKMIYYTLQKLMQKGMCGLVPGKMKKYKPANPSVAIGKFIIQSKQRIVMSQKMVIELEKQYKIGLGNTNPLEYIEIIQSNAQVVEKFKSLQKKVKKEVLAFTKGPYAIKVKSNKEGLRTIKRGIIVKSIYEADETGNADFLKWVYMFEDAGEEVRVTTKLPMKMIIFDKKIVMLTLENILSSQQSPTTMTIEHPDLAKTLAETFNMYWQKSMTLEEFKIKEKIS